VGDDNTGNGREKFEVLCVSEVEGFKTGERIGCEKWVEGVIPAELGGGSAGSGRL
jgi:hypothetical protein